MTPPVFPGLEHGRMLLANEQLAELAADVERLLPLFILEIRDIDARWPDPAEPIAVAA